MAEEYFANAPSAFAGYNITSSQINTLKSCVDDSLPPDEAAKLLTSHVEDSPTPLEVQQRLGGLWTLLNRTAVKLPFSQPKVIAILQAIRKLPRVEEPAGEGEGAFDLDDGWYWRELTGWANDWADNSNGTESKASE